MRFQDAVYFAPGVKFADVDFDSPDLPELFVNRIRGFYLKPVGRLIKVQEAFAAGLLLVTCIDALARFKFGGPVGDRFRKFVQDELQSFSDQGLPQRVYDEFRNGLVHECRIKKGSQFSLETPGAIMQDGAYLVINPRHLFAEVSAALDKYSALLTSDATERGKLADALKADHAQDMHAAQQR